MTSNSNAPLGYTHVAQEQHKRQIVDECQPGNHQWITSEVSRSALYGKPRRQRVHIQKRCTICELTRNWFVYEFIGDPIDDE